MIALLRRFFCRHREQGEAFYAGEKAYYRCQRCDKIVAADPFFADET